MNNLRAAQITGPQGQDVDFLIADILKQVDQICQPGIRRKQRQLASERYVAWRKDFQNRQYIYIEALRKALILASSWTRRRSAEADPAGFELRVGRHWIIRLPQATRYSVPGALATVLAALAFEHGHGFVGGSLSVTALSALFDAFTKGLVKLDPQQACVLDAVVEIASENVRRKDSATANVRDVVTKAAARGKMTKHNARRVLDDLISTQIVKVVCARPKSVCLGF